MGVGMKITQIQTTTKGCGKELFEHPDHPELKCYCGDSCGYFCDDCKTEKESGK